MSSEWRVARLDEVYDFSSGLSKPRSAFGSGHPFLSFRDVFYNYFAPERLEELAQTTDEERRRCSVAAGDVFLTRTSETQDELGMSCVALRSIPDATFNGFTKRLRPKPGVRIDPGYAGYYFRGPHFRRLVTAMSSLSTRASLNNEMLARLEIVLPSFDEQRRIAAVLGALDDEIELNRKMRLTLDELALGLFKGRFGGDSAIEPTSLRALAGRIRFVKGKKPPEVRHVPLTGDVPQILISSMNSGEPAGYCSPDGMTMVSENDVLMVMDGAASGRVSTGHSGAVGSTLARLDVELPVGPQYFYYWLRSVQAELCRHTTGTSIPHMDKGYLASLEVPVPLHEHAAREFEGFAILLRARIHLCQEQAATMVAVRDGLLPRLLSGELQVDDAKENAGGAA